MTSEDELMGIILSEVTEQQDPWTNTADVTMRLAFDPTKADEATVEVFNNDIARTLYLLWRRGHIVSREFSRQVLGIAKAIGKARPGSAMELCRCFSWPCDGSNCDFLPDDVASFCAGALPFFNGEKTIDYEVKDDDKPKPLNGSALAAETSRRRHQNDLLKRADAVGVETECHDTWWDLEQIIEEAEREAAGGET